MWTKFNTDSYTVGEILSIIDDALCYCFEFKIDNGELYYRETIG